MNNQNCNQTESLSDKIKEIKRRGKDDCCKPFPYIIPPGPPGPQGPPGPATIEIGTVTTGEPGTDAEVINSGTPENVVLDFTIPRGDEGTSGILNYADFYALMPPDNAAALTITPSAGGASPVSAHLVITQIS